VESLIVGLLSKHSSSAFEQSSSIDVLAPLHQLGLSSIEAMAIGADLEKITRKKLSVTLLFEVYRCLILIDIHWYTNGDH